MIDFLKILVTDSILIDKFRQNQLLTPHKRTERYLDSDLKVIYGETKQYKGILFCFYADKMEILFKPHYYFNENKHNANDFLVIDCISVIKWFIQTFEIREPQQFKIINIEFGVNALSPIDCKDLINYACYHKRNQFVNDNELRYSKKGFKFNPNGTANTYITIKFYDKGLQFSNYADINTFRFEVKSRRSQYINTLGVGCLNDLLNFKVYQEMKTALLGEFSQVLILDNDNKGENLDKRQKNKLREYLNPIKWDGLLQSKNRTAFNQTKQRYFDLLDKTGRNIHKDLYRIIEEKLNKLLADETCTYFPPVEKNEKCTYFPISIMEKRTCLGNRKCPITDIACH